MSECGCGDVGSLGIQEIYHHYMPTPLDDQITVKHNIDAPMYISFACLIQKLVDRFLGHTDLSEGC